MSELSKKEARQVERIKKYQKKFIFDNLEKETQEYRTSEIRINRFVIKELSKDELKKMSWDIALPFKAAEVKVEKIISQTVPTNIGDIHVCSPFMANFCLPTEFLIILKGKILNPISYVRAGKLLKSGEWYTSSGKLNDDDPFVRGMSDFTFLEKNKSKRLFHAIEWNQDQSKYVVIKLNWTIQLFPVDNEHFAFIFRKPRDVGLAYIQTNYFFPVFYELAIAFQYFIKKLGLEGNQTKSTPLIPTYSLGILDEYRNEIPLIIDDDPYGIGKKAEEMNSAEVNTKVIESTTGNNPLDIAKKRFAKGEISAEEFKEIKSLLEN